jgi:hypothetical protein
MRKIQQFQTNKSSLVERPVSPFHGEPIQIRFKATFDVPAVEAVTEKLPTTELAVKTGETARPVTLVVTVEEVANVPLAPVEGAVNLTDTSGTTLP